MRRKFDFRSRAPEQWVIEDVARGLANTCRFAGQLPRGVWYSVAEHSVHVSHMVPPELAMDGLLHDAVEAFMGDMPSPLKQIVPEFGHIEERLYGAMAKRFCIQEFVPPLVKQADCRILLAERDAICGGAVSEWDLDGLFKAEHPKTNFLCLPPTGAEDAFMYRYYQILEDSRWKPQ